MAAAPIAASVIGGLLSSRGSKKAAKASRPRIPAEFRPALGSALNLITAGLRNQFTSANNPFAAPFTGLQQQGREQVGSVLGAGGQAGLDEALRTIRGVSATGLDPAQIRSFQDVLAPFFEFQRQQGVAGVREAEAAGGRFFGSGGVSAEGNFLAQLEAERMAQIIPLALQAQILRLGAAQSVPSFLAGIQGLGSTAIQAGEVERSAQTQQLPGQIIPFLTQLMGGTPLFTPPIPTNFLQSLGAQTSSLASSPAFLDLFKNFGGGANRNVNVGTFDPFTGTFRG